jgi:hypothetical protein
MNLNVKGAVVMLFLEYFVLLNLYKRSQSLQVISLIVAPLMILVASYFAGDSVPKLFLAFVLMEIPLSLIGYKITPDASFIERLIVASSFGVTASLIGKAA